MGGITVCGGYTVFMSMPLEGQWLSGRVFILGECLSISSLPGKAFRMLVDIARLSERFNMHSQSQAW